MNLVLIVNIADFLEELSKEFECEVILSEENNIDYFVFEQPVYNLFNDIEEYLVTNNYVYVPMSGMKKYIKKINSVEISGKYDFIETNLEGTMEEYLIYYVVS